LVASDGLRWRARNSRAAVASKPLRVSFNALAQASISRNRSSGSEMADFMPLV